MVDRGPVWAGYEAGNRYLVEHQSLAGGWSYGEDEFCYAEPTALALLALGTAKTRIEGAPLDIDLGVATSAGLSWLENQVNEAGAIVLPGDPGTPHWASALAVYVLARLAQSQDLQRLGAQFLLGWQSIVAEPDPAIPMDTSLRGWPWYPDTFSWVIPTSQAILALRVSGYDSHSRVAEGQAMLLDRTCHGGGWNYGNREVLGQLLGPMVDTTAWALLALQRLDMAKEAVEQGLVILERETRFHPTSLSLALSLLCLDAFGYPRSNFAQLLVSRQMGDGSWQQRVDLTALAVLALHSVLGMGNAFAL